MSNPYEQPTQKCPYCGTHCDADWVDVGVGLVQCGPYHCMECGASEIGPYDNYHDPFRPHFQADISTKKDPRILTKRESETGWYEPDTPPGSSANVIGGRIVSHRQMEATYREEFVDNPLWHDKAYMENWQKKIREK